MKASMCVSFLHEVFFVGGSRDAAWVVVDEVRGKDGCESEGCSKEA